MSASLDNLFLGCAILLLFRTSLLLIHELCNNLCKKRHNILTYFNTFDPNFSSGLPVCWCNIENGSLCEV